MSVMMKMVVFEEWQKTNYLSEYHAAKTKMINQIGNYSQADAKKLEDVLNQVVTADGFNDNIASKLLSKIDSVVRRGGEKGVYQIDNNLKVSTPELNAAWSRYYQALNQYKNDSSLAASGISAEEKAKPLLKQALALQGSLNTIQGDMLESFLQMIIPIVEQKTENLGEEALDDIIASLEASITNSQGTIKTMGAQNRTMEVQLDDQTWTIKSQGKVDVSVPAPSFGENFALQISAKNYSNLRDVSLLGGGSVAGLVSQWPVSPGARDHFYNALTVWESPEQILAAGRTLFGIQSLIGAGKDEIKSNVMILNIRANKNPIRVISLPALLQDILTKNKDSDIGSGNPFRVEFNPSLQLFKKTEGARVEDEFVSRVKGLKIDTHLNKAYLHASYLGGLK